MSTGDHHSRGRGRCGMDAAAHDCPGGDRHFSISRQHPRDADPERCRAAIAPRRLRAHVLAGFSLDNLSLMALTISVGFVVDDAIVMLENIYRHIEAGLSPKEAAVKAPPKSASRLFRSACPWSRFSFPILMMSGIVGRLLREFSLTVALAIFVSAVVSLTLTPMMCARILTHESLTNSSRISRIFETAFGALLAAYAKGLTSCCGISAQPFSFSSPPSQPLAFYT